MKEVIQLEHLPPGTFLPDLALPTVSLLQREIWDNPQPTVNVAVRHLRNKHLVVAKTALSIVSAGTITTTETGDAMLHELATDPDYRGQGFGNIVLDCLEETARSLGNERVRLYAVGDNTQYFTRKGYEPEPSSVAMVKKLAAAA